MTTTSHGGRHDEDAEGRHGNDNEASCYEEGMHGRAGLAPSSQTSTLMCMIMPKDSTWNYKRLPFHIVCYQYFLNLSAIHAKWITIVPMWHRAACLTMLQHNKERIAAMNNEVDEWDEDEKESESRDSGERTWKWKYTVVQSSIQDDTHGEGT